MSKFVRLFMLLGIFVGGACSAAESNICKPICAEEKRECRAVVYSATRADTNPAFEMKERSVAKRYLGDGTVRLGVLQGNDMGNFKDRTMERNHTCDDKYMTCAKACASQAAPPVSESVVLKPKASR